ncbi:UNVERIFIED_CONTAM: hypothetical protein FKN15_074175 [Acipenser sinensis]
MDSKRNDYSNCPSLIGDLKAFNDDHRYEGLVLVATSFQDQQCQQVAVYSGNLELLNQMCCELEEAQNSSLVLEPIECVLDQIKVYKQANPSVYIDHIDQIITLMKEFIDRRQPSIVSKSRTSSTVAVAGSAPLSQRSSGITDMYSSDVEPQPMSVHFMENSQDLNESVQVYGKVNADLVSPDSGLATIQSNHSSKESSVFLSDDSPVAEIVSSYLNPVHGLPSFNPVPECETTQEQNNYDLFSFDSLHSSNIPSMTKDFLIFQPLDIQAKTQLDDRITHSQLAHGEARLVEFYDGSVDQEVNEYKNALEDEFSAEYAHAQLISSPIGDTMDKKVPRTPMNSLVECSPLDDGLTKFFPEDVIEKINEMGNKVYALTSFCQPNLWNDFENVQSTAVSPEDLWIPGMLGDIQLTPPEEENIFKLKAPETSYDKANVKLVKEGRPTPELSDEGILPTKEGSCEMDMWSSLVEKDHQKPSNSAVPESLQIWNTTIRDDTQSCDTSPGTGDFSESPEMWNALVRPDEALNKQICEQEVIEGPYQLTSENQYEKYKNEAPHVNLKVFGETTEPLSNASVVVFCKENMLMKIISTQQTDFEHEGNDKEVNSSDIDLVTSPPRNYYFSPEEEENNIHIYDALEVKQISTNEPHQTMDAFRAFSDVFSSDVASPPDFTGFETTEDEITIIQESPYMGKTLGSSTESDIKKENPCTMEASEQETEDSNPLNPAGEAMAPAKYTFTTPDGESFSQVEQEFVMAKIAENIVAMPSKAYTDL